MNDLITEEMTRFFRLRTRAHLYLVHKWSNNIASLKRTYVDEKLLNEERDIHDSCKWIDPEFTPYVLITWRYEMKCRGQNFILPEEINDALHEATFHHIKNHKHHPEFWDDQVTIDSLNKCDRDTPSAGRKVDGTKMPMTYVAAMVADWLAMSEELGSCPYDWIKKNVGIRWDFTPNTVEFIYSLVEQVWPFDRSR